MNAYHDSAPTSHVSPDGQWIWNGTEWVANSAAPAGPPPMPEPRSTHRGLKIAGGVAGVLIALGAIGAIAGGDGDPTGTPVPASQTQSQPAEEPADAPAEEPTPEPAPSTPAPATEEPAEEPADEPVSERDSLSVTQEVKDAGENIDDLNEDIADMQHDVNSGSSGWATWNYAEIAFNVGQLEAFEAPESISDEWDAAMKDLVSAGEDLSAAVEADSISKMKSALQDLETASGELEDILASW